MRGAGRASRIMTAAYALAATNKCLAQSNKSRTGHETTKKRLAVKFGAESARHNTVP
jgi:hypothetical protein